MHALHYYFRKTWTFQKISLCGVVCSDWWTDRGHQPIFFSLYITMLMLVLHYITVWCAIRREGFGFLKSKKQIIQCFMLLSKYCWLYYQEALWSMILGTAAAGSWHRSMFKPRLAEYRKDWGHDGSFAAQRQLSEHAINTSGLLRVLEARGVMG